jgi:hypothetical protein
MGTRMTTRTVPFANAPDLAADDYLIVGLATCFIKDEDGVHEVKVAEPIPSAALEALLKGIPTSYQLACATTVGAVSTGNTLQIPTGFPPETQLCDEFEARAIAAARTYKARPVAKSHIAPDTTYRNFNYSTERKRVLNSERIVKTEDNVKQHEYTHKVL